MKAETVTVYDEQPFDVEVEYREVDHWLSNPVSRSGRALKRYEVLVAGKVIGIVESSASTSSTTYKGTRIRRDLGNPVRWSCHSPKIRSSLYRDYLTRRSAFSALLGAVLR